MRLSALLLLGTALVLGACDNNNDNEKSAEAPAMRPGQPTNRPPQPPAIPEPGPETTGSVIRPATPSEGQPAAPATRAAAPDRTAPAVAGRTFTAAGSWIQFSTDNRFTWRNNSNDRLVRGIYALEGDRITFSQPQGEAAGLTFPFTCRMQPTSPDAFTLDGDGGCAALGGPSFEARG